MAIQGSAVASISTLTGGTEMPTPQQIQALAPGVRATVGPGGLAIAPAGAPPVVQAIIAAGNRIATMPYIYGGGHGNWNDAGYDCSGSVSYVLHAAGALASPLDSGQLMSYGAPGRGRWITIYANPGHAFAVIRGRRFDTTGRRDTGSRWQRHRRSTAGYRVRHPPGL